MAIVVGALTVGSAIPDVLRWAVAPASWRVVLVIAAVSALVGGLLVLLVPSDGPFAAPSPPFSLAAVPRILKDPGVLLANLGYLGHMWEVYAMWTWMAVFVAASENARRGAEADVTGLAALVTFAVVGSGAIGCWLGGRVGERWRATLRNTAVVGGAAGPGAGGWGGSVGRRGAVGGAREGRTLKPPGHNRLG